MKNRRPDLRRQLPELTQYRRLELIVRAPTLTLDVMDHDRCEARLCALGSRRSKNGARLLDKRPSYANVVVNYQNRRVSALWIHLLDGSNQICSELLAPTVGHSPRQKEILPI
jgi:hypothetical protein